MSRLTQLLRAFYWGTVWVVGLDVVLVVGYLLR